MWYERPNRPSFRGMFAVAAGSGLVAFWLSDLEPIDAGRRNEIIAAFVAAYMIVTWLEKTPIDPSDVEAME